MNLVEPHASPGSVTEPPGGRPFLLVLGTAQDGGYPQAGCGKPCCIAAWNDSSLQRFVSCLAIIDPVTQERWIIDATPDLREQIGRLDRVHPTPEPAMITGILLTHAHAGHYTGLIHLGREAMDAEGIPVHAMPGMISFLNHNGPWDQLVRLNNIRLLPLHDGRSVRLNDHLSITPFRVPHRDEYSETAGFRVEGPNASAIYIPDIDGWDRWEESIVEMVSQVSAAYLDGTFFHHEEIAGRDVEGCPHPFIEESIALFGSLPEADKSKVRFIHLNHTNPVLIPGSAARRRVVAEGMKVAVEEEQFSL